MACQDPAIFRRWVGLYLPSAQVIDLVWQSISSTHPEHIVCCISLPDTPPLLFFFSSSKDTQTFFVMFLSSCKKRKRKKPLLSEPFEGSGEYQGDGMERWLMFKGSAQEGKARKCGKAHSGSKTSVDFFFPAFACTEQKLEKKINIGTSILRL